MQDQAQTNPPLTRVLGSGWIRTLVLTGANLMYAFVLFFTRLILGSNEFRELMNTLELP